MTQSPLAFALPWKCRALRWGRRGRQEEHRELSPVSPCGPRGQDGSLPSPQLSDNHIQFLSPEEAQSSSQEWEPQGAADCRPASARFYLGAKQLWQPGPPIWGRVGTGTVAGGSIWRPGSCSKPTRMPRKMAHFPLQPGGMILVAFSESLNLSNSICRVPTVHRTCAVSFSFNEIFVSLSLSPAQSRVELCRSSLDLPGPGVPLTSSLPCQAFTVGWDCTCGHVL